MTGSEFVQKYGKEPPFVWEAAAVKLAGEGGLVSWDLVPVKLPNKEGKDVVVYVTSDVVSVGTKDDFLRLPLTPENAQKIADKNHALLPTTKIAKAIAKAATVKLTPHPLTNREPDLALYAEHNALIEDANKAQGGKPGDLITGHKKDVVISAHHMPSEKVVIYGWFYPEGATPPHPCCSEPKKEPCTTCDSDGTKYVQYLSWGHGKGFVDYSHGIRLVSLDATIDGQTVRLDQALRDPSKVALFADSATPFTAVRYGHRPDLFAEGVRAIARTRRTSLFGGYL